MKDKKVIVFDLDDTLVKERDFLISAYRAIAIHLDESDDQLLKRMISHFDSGENVFEILAAQYPKTSVTGLLDIYRNHRPTLEVPSETISVLRHIQKRGYILGLVTDGRSITQRNKILALDFGEYFHKVIISDEIGSCKPAVENFLTFNELVGQKFYIADNPAKDFFAPNKLGWITVCLLDDGRNIHKQNFNLPAEFLPQFKIRSLVELLSILDEKSG